MTLSSTSERDSRRVRPKIKDGLSARVTNRNDSGISKSKKLSAGTNNFKCDTPDARKIDLKRLALCDNEETPELAISRADNIESNLESPKSRDMASK